MLICMFLRRLQLLEMPTGRDRQGPGRDPIWRETLSEMGLANGLTTAEQMKSQYMQMQMQMYIARQR